MQAFSSTFEEKPKFLFFRSPKNLFFYKSTSCYTASSFWRWCLLKNSSLSVHLYLEKLIRAFRTCAKIIIICKNRLEKWMKNRFYYRKKKKAKKITTKERLLKGCSCREKSARLAGICLAKELSLQVRYFLLLFKKARKSFPANRGSFYHIKEKKFSC